MEKREVRKDGGKGGWRKGTEWKMSPFPPFLWHHSCDSVKKHQLQNYAQFHDYHCLDVRGEYPDF